MAWYHNDDTTVNPPIDIKPMWVQNQLFLLKILKIIPDSKVHGANMGPTWVLSAPDGLHVGPMNLAIRDLT